MSLSKQLQVRLPDDHWIWEIRDGHKRGAKVREALEFYRRFGKEFNAVRDAAEEIRTMLKEGKLTYANPDQDQESQAETLSLPDDDPRFAVLDQFLDF